MSLPAESTSAEASAAAAAATASASAPATDENAIAAVGAAAGAAAASDIVAAAPGGAGFDDDSDSDAADDSHHAGDVATPALMRTPSELSRRAAAKQRKDDAKNDKFVALLRAATAQHEKGRLDAATMRTPTHVGVDADGHAVFTLIGAELPRTRIELQLVLYAFIYRLHQHVHAPYVVVYAHTKANFMSRALFGWVKEIYSTLPRAFKKNLKHLYVVHPSFWVRTFFTFCSPFVKKKFWQKLRYVHDPRTTLAPLLRPLALADVLPAFVLDAPATGKDVDPAAAAGGGVGGGRMQRGSRLLRGGTHSNNSSSGRNSTSMTATTDAVFGGELTRGIAGDRPSLVPRPLAHAFTHLRRRGGRDLRAHEGLFRISASKSDLDAVIASMNDGVYENGGDVHPSNVDGDDGDGDGDGGGGGGGGCSSSHSILARYPDSVHLAAGLCKQYLRMLATPLIPFTHYGSFVTLGRTALTRRATGGDVDVGGGGGGARAAAATDEGQSIPSTAAATASAAAAAAPSSSASSSSSRADVIAFVRALPQPSRAVLVALASLLCEVATHSAQNKMTTSNLAILFAPTIARPDDASPAAAMAAVTDLPFTTAAVEAVLDVLGGGGDGGSGVTLEEWGVTAVEVCARIDGGGGGSGEVEGDGGIVDGGATTTTTMPTTTTPTTTTTATAVLAEPAAAAATAAAPIVAS